MASAPMISVYEDILAGSIVSLICGIGNFMMTLVIIGSSRIPSMKSSFGMLTINQNLAEMIPCTTCFIIFFFGYTLNWKTVIDNSYLIGASAIITVHIILISFLLISLNRLCAILFPIAYNGIFKGKFLAAFFAANWLIPLSISTFILVFRQCRFVIVHEGWFFDESKNEICGSLLEIYRSFQTPLALITTVVDLSALLLLVILRNRIFKSKSVETRRREMNFARQVLVQGFVFTIHAFWYQGGRNLMPTSMPENWKIFWTTSFSSNLLHIFDP
ncbi:CRE-SRX-42 protein [Caenorhabditis remanei]|uniref:CRE-SRX-42 protein n=1 Tax=Caenorhabditis remanei TaxID=31234 RepID=E3M0J1_CAERE|nr:CRE-SRX-42 protein [Caenorhabditis remanei]